MISPQNLRKILKDSGLVTDKQFSKAQAEARRTNKKISDVLIGEGFVSEKYLSELLADYYKVPFIDLKKEEIKPKYLKLLSSDIAESKRLIIFDKEGDTLKVAMEDPQDLDTLEFLEAKTGYFIKPYLATPTDITNALKQYRMALGTEFERVIAENIERSTEKALKDPERMARDIPIINILDTIIKYGIANNASDIHLEPEEDKTLVRFRIEGFLKDITSLAKEIHPALVARIKILSKLRIDEHRMPQDGRFKFTAEGQRVAIRVSVMPSFYGEKVVLRLLMGAARPLSLTELGLSSKDLKIVQNNITKPQGMILSTGPTGCGKTTTLYAIIHTLNKPEVNITTIEDPIEYDIPRVTQTQVKPSIGLTFARGLRSLLRQAPNIIMVGEIRDKETAEIAVHAAMTGHLVLSTVHTNDAVGTVSRLVDLGVESYLLSSTLTLAIAQRLVRRICLNCIESYEISSEMKKIIQEQLRKLEIDETKISLPKRVYRGKGCDQCSHTGYKGQIGIFEVLRVTKRIRDLITRKATREELYKTALEEGMTPLFVDGLAKVETGVTTIEEVLRVTRE